MQAPSVARPARALRTACVHGAFEACGTARVARARQGCTRVATHKQMRRMHLHARQAPRGIRMHEGPTESRGGRQAGPPKRATLTAVSSARPPRPCHSGLVEEASNNMQQHQGSQILLLTQADGTNHRRGPRQKQMPSFTPRLMQDVAGSACTTGTSSDFGFAAQCGAQPTCGVATTSKEMHWPRARTPENLYYCRV